MSAANTLISRLALGLAFLAGAGALATSIPARSDEKPSERILIGIDYAFPPHQWLDESGEPRGFDVDLIRAVADAVGLTYEIRGGPWNEIRDQLERGEIDIAAAMVQTKARDLLLDFSIPTVTVAYSIPRS